MNAKVWKMRREPNKASKDSTNAANTRLITVSFLHSFKMTKTRFRIEDEVSVAPD